MSLLFEILRNPEVVRGTRRLIRRHPIAAVAVGTLLGVTAFAMLTRPSRTPRDEPFTAAGLGPARGRDWIPPPPAEVEARERAVRVWAYRLGQGEVELAQVPADLAYDVERYRMAGGREPAGSADGAIPFDW